MAEATITATLADVGESILVVSEPPKPLLTVDNINPRVLSAQYAVRGELAVMSETYRRDLAEKNASEHKLPFDQVISANIGNPQQLDQKPITFFRQVLSLLEHPELINFEGEGGAKKREHVEALYPKDAIERSRSLLEACGSVGAYSASQGVYAIRKNVAKFLEGSYPTTPPRNLTNSLQSATASLRIPNKSSSPPVPPPASIPSSQLSAPAPIPAS